MTTQVRMVAVAVGLIACSTPRASAEILVETEGYSFKVGSIGSSPTGVGADVDNSLRLDGLGPAVRVGVSLGSTRSLEFRWRRLRADYTYATALPYLVLNGEQGSAKTLLCKLLRALIDPNAAPVRALPRDDREAIYRSQQRSRPSV